MEAEPKDLVIAAACGYEYDQLKNWVNSLRRTGFEGDVVLVGTNLKKETINKLTAEGIELALYGTPNARGDIEAHKSGIEPHVERFFYIWNYLNNTDGYRFVITTDVRDVVFQENPSTWLKNQKGLWSLYVGNEGLAYENEPWGSANLYNTFGPFFHQHLKEKTIFNVGVIAGVSETLRDFMMMIFQMSVNRPLRICDQATFNFLINLVPYVDETKFCFHEDGFVTHLGTSRDAIIAGKGDIGQNYMHDPAALVKYDKDYFEDQPTYKDGIVYNKAGEKFVIVHQYDRIPELKDQVDKLYG